MKRDLIPPLSEGDAIRILKRLAKRHAKSFHYEKYRQRNIDGITEQSWRKNESDGLFGITVVYGNETYLRPAIKIITAENSAVLTLMETDEGFVFGSMMVIGETGHRWGQMLFKEYRAEALNWNERLEAEREAQEA